MSITAQKFATSTFISASLKSVTIEYLERDVICLNERVFVKNMYHLLTNTGIPNLLATWWQTWTKSHGIESREATVFIQQWWVVYANICWKKHHIPLLAPLTMSAQRSWWYYWLSVVRRRRPSVNFCFKSLLLLQFLFENSEFFTRETRHIVPPCNKAGISNFCLEFQKLQKFQISWKRYSSYSSHSIILNFLLEKLGI